MLHPTKKEVKSCFPYKAMSKFYELRDFPLFTGCAIEEFLHRKVGRISQRQRKTKKSKAKATNTLKANDIFFSGVGGFFVSVCLCLSFFCC